MFTLSLPLVVFLFSSILLLPVSPFFISLFSSFIFASCIAILPSFLPSSLPPSFPLSSLIPSLFHPLFLPSFIPYSFPPSSLIPSFLPFSCIIAGNKYGEPVVCGFARSFGQRLPNKERVEWIKPIMFTAGLGWLDSRHTVKGE